MKLSDLVKDSQTKMMSHSKLWANVGYAVATWFVIHQALAGKASDDLILYYLGIVALHATGSKFVGSTKEQVGV